MLFDKEPGAGRTDEVHTAQTAMDRFAALVRFGRMANAHDGTLILLGQPPQAFQEGAGLIGAVHVDAAAEIGLHRRQGWIDLRQVCAVRNVILAPPLPAQNVVPNLKRAFLRLHDLSNATPFERLAKLKRLDVARLLDHAPAHAKPLGVVASPHQSLLVIIFPASAALSATLIAKLHNTSASAASAWDSQKVISQELIKRHGRSSSRLWVMPGFAGPGVVLHPRYTACSAVKEGPCLTPAYYRDCRQAGTA